MCWIRIAARLAAWWAPATLARASLAPTCTGQVRVCGRRRAAPPCPPREHLRLHGSAAAACASTSSLKKSHLLHRRPLLPLAPTALRGELRTRSRWSKCPQPDRQGIGLTFAQYGLPPPIGLVHADSSRAGCCFQTAGAGAIGGHTSRPLFDAIITDPPYGIRERSAALDDAALSRRTLTTVQHETHVPRTVAVSLRDILADLFHLAERSVVQGGWLVFLLPSMLPLDQALALLPPHPGLRLMSASEQRMGARWSRWCIAMLRLPDRQGIAKPDEPAVDEGVPPGLRSAIFRSRAEQAGGAPTMPVLHPELRNKVDRRKSGKTPRFGPVRATTGPCSATHCSVDAAVRVVGAGVVRLTIRATN